AISLAVSSPESGAVRKFGVPSMGPGWIEREHRLLTRFRAPGYQKKLCEEGGAPPLNGVFFFMVHAQFLPWQSTKRTQDIMMESWVTHATLNTEHRTHGTVEDGRDPHCPVDDRALRERPDDIHARRRRADYWVAAGIGAESDPARRQ